ncbi:hypothetical protein K490DRAFT_60033 [Saccharata proteae CBS 121410]|uniref:Uncharacterized protein n=1 Tax=Saccharata proteae CBS 121410 TaxID=1314787 RepID=A0A9P4HNT9_9PEZI|nr:hypothetical protein K490DRAFT_60033 [Saccharata proteae CBS 121410]
MLGSLFRYSAGGASQTHKHASSPMSADQPNHVGDSEQHRSRIPHVLEREIIKRANTIFPRSANRHAIVVLPSSDRRFIASLVENLGEAANETAQKQRPIHDGPRAPTVKQAAEGLLEGLTRFLPKETEMQEGAAEIEDRTARTASETTSGGNSSETRVAMALPQSNASGGPDSSLRSGAPSPSPSMAPQTTTPGPVRSPNTLTQNSGSPSQSSGPYMLDPSNIEVRRLHLQLGTVEKRLEEDAKRGDKGLLSKEFKKVVVDKVAGFRKLLEWEAEGVGTREVEVELWIGFIGRELRGLLEGMRVPGRRVVSGEGERGGKGGEHKTEGSDSKVAAQDAVAGAQAPMTESGLHGLDSSFVHVGKSENDKEDNFKTEPNDKDKSGVGSKEANGRITDTSTHGSDDQKVHLRADEESAVINQLQNILHDTEHTSHGNEGPVQDTESQRHQSKQPAPSNSFDDDDELNHAIRDAPDDQVGALLEAVVPPTSPPSRHQSEGPSQSPSDSHDGSDQNLSNSPILRKRKPRSQLRYTVTDDGYENVNLLEGISLNDQPPRQRSEPTQSPSNPHINQSQGIYQNIERAGERSSLLQIVDLGDEENSHLRPLIPAEDPAYHGFGDTTQWDDIDDHDDRYSNFIFDPEEPRGGVFGDFEVIEPELVDNEESDDPPEPRPSAQVDGQVPGAEHVSLFGNAVHVPLFGTTDQVPDPGASEQVDNQVLSPSLPNNAPQAPAPEASEQVDSQVLRASPTRGADHVAGSNFSEQVNDQASDHVSDMSDSSDDLGSSISALRGLRNRFSPRATRVPRRPPPVPVSPPVTTATSSTNEIVQNLAAIDLDLIDNQLSLMARRNEESSARRAAENEEQNARRDSENLTLYDYLHKQEEQRQNRENPNAPEDPPPLTSPTDWSEFSSPPSTPPQKGTKPKVPGTWHNTDSETETLPSSKTKPEAKLESTAPVTWDDPNPPLTVTPEVKARLVASHERLGWSPETRGNWPVIQNPRRKVAPVGLKKKALWVRILIWMVKVVAVLVEFAVLLVLALLVLAWAMGAEDWDVEEWKRRIGMPTD